MDFPSFSLAGVRMLQTKEAHEAEKDRAVRQVQADFEDCHKTAVANAVSDGYGVIHSLGFRY